MNDKQLERNLRKLKELTDEIVKHYEEEQTDKVRELTDTSVGDVCWTRLYKEDEELINELCRKTHRKKAQVIRILVYEGIRQGFLSTVYDTID